MTFDWQTPKKGQVEIEHRAIAAYRTDSDEKPGTWHRMELTLQNQRWTLMQDGKPLVPERNRIGNGRSPIGLKAVGDPVVFANVFIKELP